MKTAPKRWTEGAIQGVAIRPLRKFTDSRGWLGEVFRSDESSPGAMPQMGYLSVTNPGMARGPHSHAEQTDVFVFAGPGVFELKIWDNRPDSPTRGHMQTIKTGEENPLVAEIPPGIVHGYRNISSVPGLTINLPNRLYAGKNRKSPVDEVRYENDPNSEFVI